MGASVSRAVEAHSRPHDAHFSRIPRSPRAPFVCIKAPQNQAKSHLLRLTHCNSEFFQTWQGFCLVAYDSCTDAVAVTKAVQQVVQGVFFVTRD